jgi:hypothetical protein
MQNKPNSNPKKGNNLLLKLKQKSGINGHGNQNLLNQEENHNAP